MAYEPELEFAKAVALEAGAVMRKYFRSDQLNTVRKDDLTPLTVTDSTINALVIERVKRDFPGHGVLGEEESYFPNRSWIWVVDPIDGTIPYSCGIPVSTFSLALVARSDGQPVVSVTLDPFLDELMYAVLGQGSFLEGKKGKLQTSDVKSLHGEYISQGSGLWSSGKGPDLDMGPIVTALQRNETKGLNFLSAVYGARQVARGKFATSFLLYGSPWESAEVALLVREAGGIVSDVFGK